MKEKEKQSYSENLDTVASIISKTERVADKLEEDSVKIKLIEYMQDKIGNIYIARLSGMNKNKVFMELENHIEVVYNVLTSRDNFVYDEENFKIKDKKNNISYTMGNTMKVIVTGASYQKMEIEVIPYVENIQNVHEIELEEKEG